MLSLRTFFYSVDNVYSKAQAFTSAGTWTQPTGVTGVMAVVVGGGGSTGGTWSTGRLTGCGGGGAVCWGMLPVMSSVAVTVGAGGVAPSTFTSGVAGGFSQFDLLVSYGGGYGGYGDNGGIEVNGGSGGGGGGVLSNGSNGATTTTNSTAYNGAGGCIGNYRGGGAGTTSLRTRSQVNGGFGPQAVNWFVGGGGGRGSSSTSQDIGGFSFVGGVESVTAAYGGYSYGRGAFYTLDAEYGGGGCGYSPQTNSVRNGGNGVVIVFWSE